MLNIRRALMVVLSILALGAVLPVAASSAGPNTTKIVVSLKLPAFHGKLTSPRKACLGSRKVKLFRARKGKIKLLGRDTSAAGGKWVVPIGKNIPPGSYYAKVAKRGKCKAAKSKVLKI